MPGKAFVASVVNQATGDQLSLTGVVANYSGTSSAQDYTQTLMGIAANQTYLVTVAFDNGSGDRITGSPLTQFVPPMWNTPLASAADFDYGVNSVPGQSSGAYVGPLVAAGQGTATFVFRSGSSSPTGGAIALTLNTGYGRHTCKNRPLDPNYFLRDPRELNGRRYPRGQASYPSPRYSRQSA